MSLDVNKMYESLVDAADSRIKGNLLVAEALLRRAQKLNDDWESALPDIHAREGTQEQCDQLMQDFKLAESAAQKTVVNLNGSHALASVIGKNQKVPVNEGGDKCRPGDPNC